VGAGAGGDGGKTGGEEAPPAKKAKRESVKQEPLPGAEAKSGTQSSIPLKQRASPGAKQVGCLPQPETQNSKPETRNLKTETRNPKSETRKPTPPYSEHHGRGCPVQHHVQHEARHVPVI